MPLEPLNPPAAAIMLEQADARPGRAVAGVRGNFMHRAYGDVWRVAFRRPGHIFGSLSFRFFSSPHISDLVFFGSSNCGVYYFFGF